jgi:hypothetical protein
MYILLIGYLFVIVMFSAVVGASNWPLGLFFFVLLAVLPTWLIVLIKRSVQRKKAEVKIEQSSEQ